MNVKLRHNTMMRLIFGSILFIGIPGLLFLAAWPIVGGRGALAMPALIWSGVIYGFFFGWRHIVVRAATCRSGLLPPAFEGYRVLQLSDIHIGTFLRNRGFYRQVGGRGQCTASRLGGLYGDLVNVSADELIRFSMPCGRSMPRRGVFHHGKPRLLRVWNRQEPAQCGSQPSRVAVFGGENGAGNCCSTRT